MQDSLGISRGQRKITLERREDKDILGTSRGAKNTIFLDGISIPSFWSRSRIMLHSGWIIILCRIWSSKRQSISVTDGNISYGRKQFLTGKSSKPPNYPNKSRKTIHRQTKSTFTFQHLHVNNC